MRRLFFLFSFLCLMASEAVAQQFEVLSITGSVEVGGEGEPKHELMLREKLTPSSFLNVPFKAKIELLDEKKRVMYTIKTPGYATLGSMVANKQNSVLRLTEQYLSYLKTRLKGKGELTSRKYSDPATVTREVVVKRNDYEEEFNAFRQQAQAEYDAFRQQAIREYADFVRKAWQEFGAQPPRPIPVIEEVPPVVMSEDSVKPIKAVRIAIEKKVLKLPKIDRQPIPITPIQEQKVDLADYVDFMFYGTPLRVRFTSAGLFSLSEPTPDAVADVFGRLAGQELNNTIRDCLELRIRYQLGDWAYLQMLDSLSQNCLTSKNEATLLMAYLFQQSGYKMRLGLQTDTLCLLYSSNHHVYGKPYFYIDHDDYYVYKYNSRKMSICEAAFPKEQPLSLFITEQPMLAENSSEERTLRSVRYDDMSFTSVVNKNLIDFYSSYPTSMVDGNFLTRWGMYANTPLDATISSSLLPALHEKLQGLSNLQAVERLLNWVQTAFKYELDDVVWGDDRAFFAEETLYYPYCDCEDRSILLSHLVRDLLGLKVVLVYYPGHLATAVCFGEDDVVGDYIDLNGKKYVVCDPTYIGARVGQTMTNMDNQIAKVLLLE